MAKSLHQGTSSTTYNASTSNFAAIGHGGHFTNNSVETNQQTIMRFGGVASNFYCRILTNGTSATSMIVFRKNAANGSQSLAIGIAATGEFSDATNTDTLKATDLIDARFVVGAGGNIQTSILSFIFDARVHGTRTIHLSNNNGGALVASASNFLKLFASDDQQQAAEADVQMRVYTAGFLRNFNFKVNTNGRSTTSTCGSRINGVDGLSQLSIGAAATGQFHDAVNIDNFVATDLINSVVVAGSGTGTLSGIRECTVESQSGECHYFCGHATFNAVGTTINANLTRYTPIAGSMTIETTESNASGDMAIAGTLKGLAIAVATNTLTAASTGRTRINAGNGAQSVSIGSGSTGFFEDASNTDTIAAGDNLNYSIVTGATGTSIIIRYFRTVFVAPVDPFMSSFFITRQAVPRSNSY